MAGIIFSICIFFIWFGLLFVYLFKKQKQDHADNMHDEYNLSTFRDREKELNDEKLLSGIDDEAHAELLNETKKALLVDVPEQKHSTQIPLPKHPLGYTKRLFASVFLVIVLSVCLYLAVFFKQPVWQGYQSEQQYAALVASSVDNQVFDPALASLSTEELIPLLQHYALADLKDPNRWLFLGNVFLKFNALESAEKALSKAFQLKPTLNTGKAYIDVLFRLGEGEAGPKVDRVLAAMAKQAPNDPELTLMRAALYFKRARYVEAIDLWSSLLRRQSVGEPELSPTALEGKRLIESYIAQAKHLLAQQEATARSTVATKATNSTPVKQSDDMAETNKEVMGGELEKVLNIALSFKYSGELPKSGYLWVVAKAVSGPRAPLAVIKMPFSSVRAALSESQQTFPLSISKQNAMMPQMTINDFEDLEIKVRVTEDANVDLANQVWGAVQAVPAWKSLTSHVDITVEL